MSDAPAAPVTENGVPPAAQESIVEETPGFKVFAGNLAYSTTDEGLKTLFEPVQSDILTAQVILRGTRSAGYGFVSLSSAEAAQKAVELLNKKELDGREVIIEIAKPADQKEKKQTRFKRRQGRRGAKAVPGEVSEAEANGHADAQKSDDAASPIPAADEAAKPKKKKKGPRKPKRKTTPAADGAEATDDGADAPVDGAPAEAVPKKQRPRKARAPRPPRPAGEDPAGEPSKSVLFVANLGFSIDDAGLSALFTEAGIDVKSARIVRRRWGKPRRSKGYGFVDVGTPEEQQKAIEALQGKEVGGRPIAVKIAVDSQVEHAEAEAESEAEAKEAPTTEEATA